MNRKGKEMFKDKISKELVRERMAYPYEIKVRMTERRLSEFITYYGESGVAVSISGGLDSTAAMHFIHARYPRVEAVSVLGIECRDNIKMVMKIRDEWGVKVNTAAPKMTQEAVIKEFGYPIVSKRAAKSLSYLQNPTEENANSRRLALTGITNEGKYAKTWVLAKKWRFLIDAPFKISAKCCYYMKETAADNWAKENGKASIVATLVEESQSRMNGYCKKGGCNSFEGRGESTPFSFWTRQDILRYLHENNVEISAAYGEIVKDENGIYKTTKAQRTGCPICMFGMERDGTPNRFQRMYYEDNSRWQQAIFKWGYKEVLDFFIENGFTNYQYYPQEILDQMQPDENKQLNLFDK